MELDNYFLDGYVPETLSLEETTELLKTLPNLPQNREKLVLHNIRLVIYLVNNKYNTVGYDEKDLISIGIIGLIKGIETYDINKGYKFTTYISKCIENEILMFLRKLKKDHRIDSFSTVINKDRDNNELTLEEKISDGSDMVYDYEIKDEYERLNRIIEELPIREREVIKMCYGFYDDKIYSQREIANRFNVSQPHISRILTKALVKIKYKLEHKNFEKQEIKEELKIEKKGKKRMPKIKSIYSYFNSYSKEDIDSMISKLSEDEKKLIRLRYGDDLENPVAGTLTREQTNSYYGNLIPKMRRLLKNPDVKSRDKKSSKKVNLVKEKPEQLEKVANAEEEETIVTKNDALRILELLRKPTFGEMLNTLNVKEAIVISLKLGYVDGKCFSTESIAEFLDMEKEEVVETTKKALILYRELANKLLDDVIDVATDNKPVLLLNKEYKID